MKFKVEYINGCNWMVGDFYQCEDGTPGILSKSHYSLCYVEYRITPKRTDIKKRLSYPFCFFDNELIYIIIGGTKEEIKEYYDKELKHYITEMKRIKKLQNNYEKWLNR